MALEKDSVRILVTLSFINNNDEVVSPWLDVMAINKGIRKWLLDVTLGTRSAGLDHY